jgi:hypothetical protein
MSSTKLEHSKTYFTAGRGADWSVTDSVLSRKVILILGFYKI